MERVYTHTQLTDASDTEGSLVRSLALTRRAAAAAAASDDRDSSLPTEFCLPTAATLFISTFADGDVMLWLAGPEAAAAAAWRGDLTASSRIFFIICIIAYKDKDTGVEWYGMV